MVLIIFFLQMYEDKVNSTCHTSTMKPSLPARRVLHKQYNILFSNSHQNCSEIVPAGEIMGNKTDVMIGQRISRLGKSRRKWDLSPLYSNVAFFSMRGNLKMRLPCITQFHLFLYSQLQDVVRESPQRTKCTTFVL